MKIKNTDIITQNKIFLWIALGVGILLLIPLTLTLLGSGLDGDGCHWTLSDFIIMGFLMFGVASLFVLIARKIINKKYRVAIAIILVLVFFWFWAELAVGVFTNWGS